MTSETTALKKILRKSPNGLHFITTVNGVKVKEEFLIAGKPVDEATYRKHIGNGVRFTWIEKKTIK